MPCITNSNVFKLRVLSDQQSKKPKYPKIMFDKQKNQFFIFKELEPATVWPGQMMLSYPSWYNFKKN